VAGYLSQLDTADWRESATAPAKVSRLQDKIATLRQEVRRLKKLEVRMLKAPDQQISLTDPDGRSRRNPASGDTLRGPNMGTSALILGLSTADASCS